MGKIYFLVDVESTGVNFLKDHVFDIGVIVSDGVQVIDKYQKYIRVLKELLLVAKSNIGHIIDINIDLIYKNGSDIASVCDEFIQFILSYEKNNQLFFVAHNVDFDYNMILQTLIKAKKNNHVSKFESLFSQNKIDTIELAKSYFPGLQNYSLQKLVDQFNLCQHLSERRKYNKHSALLDCEILAVLFHYLKIKSPFEDLLF